MDKKRHFRFSFKIQKNRVNSKEFWQGTIGWATVVGLIVWQ